MTHKDFAAVAIATVITMVVYYVVAMTAIAVLVRLGGIL